MWPSSNNSNMYSNNQWSFNPAVYQNVPYEQVDWASLAQQWIKMKETLPSGSQGPPPTPVSQVSKPSESVPVVATPSNDIEGGEAPMDMDTKDEEPVGVTPSGNWNQWGNWQSQWGWGWSGNAGTVPLTENAQPTTSTVDSKVKSPNNDSIPVFNNVRNFPIIGNTGTCTPQVPSSFNYNNSGGGLIPPVLPKTNFNFENNFPSVSAKGSAESWSKTKSKQVLPKPAPVESFPVIDAAKKKQLPAWIREGLTKMEREKQKKLERERMLQEKLVMEQMKTDEPEEIPSQNYAEVPESLEPVPEYIKKPPSEPVKYEPPKHQSPVPESRQRLQIDSSSSRKTKDQIMEESMLKVRRILTEILLEATEKQVQLVAKEEYRRFKAASAQQIRKSNALTSLTGNLGLDVYDSGSASSDSEHRDDDGYDSDEELKMLIEKKQRDFELIEDEIEREIEDHEAKEKVVAQKDRDEGDNNEDDNDDEEDEPKTKSNREKDFIENHQRQLDNERFQPPQDERGRRHSTSDVKQLNGDSKSTNDTNRSRPKKKSSSRSSSSSSSSPSTSNSSSANSSSDESSSSKSNRSGNSSTSKKKRKKRKMRKKDDRKKHEKRSKRRDTSESGSERHGSTSRSRYYDRYKRNSDSADRKRRRRSPSYRRRSPSYHRRRESERKYKDSPRRRRDYSPDSKRSRYRSSSRESSKHLKYKRH